MEPFNLNNHKKINSGFKTPEGYFDHFSEELMQQLPEKETKVISLFGNKTKWIMAVAAILIIALILPFFNQSIQESENMDLASLENYLSYQPDISQYEIINLLDDNDIQEINIDMKINDSDLEDILVENDNLELYLNE